MAYKLIKEEYCPCADAQQKEFLCDTDADFATLPKCCPGSTAVSVASKNVYMVNASGRWVLFGGGSDGAPLEGDGAEYYTLAPTALSFRSTAPLDEFQEVQVNGATVDPANYTLEEGSTIVKLSIDYLKTLNTGNYEVAVVSKNTTVKGNFTVAAPELNEYGFYYNQPYAGYAGAFEDYVALFFHENGTLDLNFVNTGEVFKADFTSSVDGIVINSPDGTFNATVSVDGTAISCKELNADLMLSDMLVADECYIYIRTAYGSTDCYSVTGVVDKTKTHYPPMRTGINGLPTLEMVEGLFVNNTNLTSIEILDSLLYIPDSTFYGCTNLSSVTFGKGSQIFNIGAEAFRGCMSLTSITLPDSITTIGIGAFDGCSNLKSITFRGTIAQWNAISFTHTGAGTNPWNNKVPATHVQCSDGQVAL